jgi:2-amino-4-hydroxy-6-hydroxymethyldihydropteridine diphosphokinase
VRAGTSVECWIGIGSNLGDPVGQVRDSFDALDAIPGTTLRQTSGLYRTAPMGPQDQPDYINAVAKLETRLAPNALLDAMQAIERSAGRARTIKWGPRVLDLDLLTYGDQCLDEAGLQVPHPGIRDRNFVLLPLLSVAPDLEIPGLGSVRQLAAATGDEGIVRLD